MSNVLVVAEQGGGTLSKATLHAISAGRELAKRTGGKLHLALLGKGVGRSPRSSPATAPRCTSPTRRRSSIALAEAYAPVVPSCEGDRATLVGAAATAQGKDLLPRVAARLGAGMATEVLGFGGEGAAVTFRGPMWAGNVLAEVELATPVKVFTVRATEFAAPRRKGKARSREAAVLARRRPRSDAARLLPARSRASGPSSPRRASSSRAAAARRATSSRSRRSPTSSTPPSAPAAPRWTRAGSRTTGRSARPARWSRPSSTSRPASPAPSSTWPA